MILNSFKTNWIIQKDIYFTDIMDTDSISKLEKSQKQTKWRFLYNIKYIIFMFDLSDYLYLAAGLSFTRQF